MIDVARVCKILSKMPKKKRKSRRREWNTEAIRLTLATYVTQPVTRAFGWCLHCVFRVDGTPSSSSDGALISSCSGAEIAPLCELGRWGGCGAGLFLRCLNVLVPVEFVPVIDVPPLPSVVVSGSFSRISSFSCCMFVFCGKRYAVEFLSNESLFVLILYKSADCTCFSFHFCFLIFR